MGTELAGRTVLITGAANGMGKAIVETFVNEGASVVGFDRAATELDTLRNSLGSRFVPVVGDVTSPRDNATAVTAALDTFSALDVFVGNAGVWDFATPLESLDLEMLPHAFTELFQVNVLGYMLGVRASLDCLRKAKGAVILTLSNAAMYPGGGGPLYTASKHAGLGLIRQLAYELAPDIRVNGVAPGGMATALRGTAALGHDDRTIGTSFPIDEIMRSKGALRRAATPADYVGAYSLLAGNRALSATGSLIDLSSFGTPGRDPE